MTVFQAIRLGNATALQNLLNEQPHLANQPDEKGMSPLVLATYLNDLDSTRALVEGGAEINQGGGVGTALMGAAFKGHTDIVAFLLERGADPRASNQAGQTALDFARMGGNPETIRLLSAPE